ncbi:methionine-R-sulfoxide reductase B1 isoform X2 [Pteropus medius]|uniref:methionine-R-sulfoxide reductase B1 isoform X2 n=1 Tax=Pteropus vampyrus TaxID=132908 RepID=UPI00196B2339|nr:methionine-R-sulfoxide reductase B1 isoform X2 [Pteropus giganteus]
MSFCSFFGGEVFQNHFEPGVYVCAKCGYELFSSCSKYAHSSPWPAFTETIHADSVAKRPDHNQPEALKTKKLQLPRGSRRAALTHPRWALRGGHTLALPTWNWSPGHSDGEGGVAETSGRLPRLWLCTGSLWEKHWFATCVLYPTARTDPAVGLSWPLTYTGASGTWV